MRIEAYVAASYLRGKRKNRFVSLITFISIAGVSVGVIALIVVMSVMTGFQLALRETIIGNRAHIVVMDRFGEPLTDYEPVREALLDSDYGVEAASPIIQVKGLIERTSARGSKYQEGAFIMGVDPDLETSVTDLATNLTDEGGRFRGAGTLPGTKEIVLGYGLADSIRAYVGDMIAVYAPRARVAPTGMTFRPVYVRVSGIAHTQMSEFDSYYGWVNLDTARMLTGGDGVDGVHCKLDDPMRATEVAAEIQSALGYSAVTWYESNRAFFDALKKEKVVMFIILVCIVLVAVFNISSTLIMVVMEKRRDIGILRTMGVSQRSILLLFMMEGLFIGIGGTLAGVIIGCLLAANINWVAESIASLFGINLWETTIYYFDRVPSQIVPMDVFIITVSAVVLTFVSTLYPAWSAARIDPVDAMRNE